MQNYDILIYVMPRFMRVYKRIVEHLLETCENVCEQLYKEFQYSYQRAYSTIIFSFDMLVYALYASGLVGIQ